MILGVSHAVIGCASIDVAIPELAQLGYRVEFIDKNLANFGGKSKFLSKPFSTHQIAFTRASQGVPIELVSYDEMAAGNFNCFTGVFGQQIPNGPSIVCEPLRDTDFGGLDSHGAWRAVRVPHLVLNAYFDSTHLGEPGGLIGAALLVGNLGRAAEIWVEGLGFRPGLHTQDGLGRRCLPIKFRSPVSAWNIDLVLIDNLALAGPRPPLLNSLGFCCLSLLSSDIRTDGDRLMAKGAAASTGQFESRVNGKTLLVEMFRSVDGEFIELLQISRDAAAARCE